MARATLKTHIRRVLGALAAVAVISVGIVAAPVGQEPARAANITDGFDPGYIISDELFYDGDAMTAAEIQTFLNTRVTRCTLGDPGREKGKPTNWNGPTFLAQECLKDFRVSAPARNGDRYCKAYSAVNNATAAQLIAKIAEACDISPRVILIMLEKEQSLVTDSWPTVKMFDIAMGFRCFDTGPNYSANCDPDFLGFANQLYWGTRQLKVYRDIPAESRPTYYKDPFTTERIQYHPDPSCGSSLVYIENWATAALYTYTPYQPNKATLAAGWGEAPCGAYGNRNFYNFYKSWFGQPNVKFTVPSALATQASKLGWTAESKAVTSSAGVYQKFSGGYIFQANGHAVTWMTTNSPITKAYQSAGFVTGSWGWPTKPAQNLGSSGNNVMVFTGGTVVESDGVRAVLIDPQLLSHWNASGGFTGSLGAPMNAAKKANGAVEQTFKKGTAVRDTAGTVRIVDPTFLSAWTSGGGVANPLGTPTGNASTITANGGGKVYALTKGAMYSHAGGITTLPAGTILTAYNNAGGASGAWGWPVSQPRCTSTECSADFTNGVAVWSSLRGTQFTPYTQIPQVPTDPNAKNNLLGGTLR